MNLAWSQPGREWGRRPGVRGIAEVDVARPPVGEADGSAGVGDRPAGMPDGAELRRRIGTTALAFRGYDVANLGRSRELLEHAAYGPTVRRHLEQASAVCSEAIGAEVDLVEFVRAGRPTSLETFPHDIATIVAMEIAQVALLEEFFEVPVRQARLSFGYSIGELSALVFGGVFSMEQLLPVPLELAADAAELAARHDDGRPLHQGPRAPRRGRRAALPGDPQRGEGADRAFGLPLAQHGPACWARGTRSTGSSARCPSTSPARSCSGASRTGGLRCIRPWSGSGTSPIGPPSRCTGSRARWAPRIRR